MNKEYDVIIIGAGIIGCATAFELSKKSHRTLNLDKNPVAGYGSTSNSCAIVRAHYSTYDGVTMAYENFYYWQNWEKYLDAEDESGYAQFRNTGTILLKTRGHDFEKVLRLYREVGVEFEEWDLEELERRMPLYDHHCFYPPRRPSDPKFWIKPEEQIDGVIYTPGSGYVNDPQLATHNLMRAAEAKGGEFLFNSEVKSIPRANGRVQGVVLADGTRIDAPVVVNVSGPHSFVINRMAGVEEGMNIKTRALRHEVHHVHSPEGFDFQRDGYHTSDGDTAIYFRPETGNSILVGSEDPECDEKIWVDDPDNFDRNVTPEQWEAQVYRLAKRIPSLRIPNRPRGLVDLYDVSDDWIPIYDKSDLKGFYMAVGTSGNQFKNASVVGVLMRDLIEACEGGHDHDADPVQVKCRHTGLTLNSGFYSRLREINPDSSFSVNG